MEESYETDRVSVRDDGQIMVSMVGLIQDRLHSRTFFISAQEAMKLSAELVYEVARRSVFEQLK